MGQLQHARRAQAPSRPAPGRATVRDPPRVLGNQAQLRLLASAGLQPKLQVGAVDDPLEREADAVADKVMRMPGPAPALTPSPPRVSRKCAACEEKKDRVLPRHEPASAFSAGGPAPPVVQRALAGPGQPLDRAARGFFEPRFGRDLSSVRVHTDAGAAESAAAIQARAYTAGGHLVFGRGQYQPGSADGRRLIAHELAHTFQQDAGRAVRRKLTTPSAADATEVAGHLNSFCSGGVTTKGADLAIVPGSCGKNDAGCDCVCEAVLNPVRVFTVSPKTAAVSKKTKTLFDGSSVQVPESTVWPSTSGLDKVVDIEIPKAGSTVEFGAFKADGKGFWQPTWRILAHELCGHGVKKQTYAGDRGDRKGHNSTIDTENKISAKQGQPARGHYADPRQGESFDNEVGDRSKVFFQNKGPCPAAPDPAVCLHFEAP